MKSIIFVLSLFPLLCNSQVKKILDHSAYNVWRSVEDELISNDGKYVAYATEPNGIGNSELKLHKNDGAVSLSYHRASGHRFTNNSQFLVFKISPDLFETRDLKRQKVKEKDLPKDTLGIYKIESGELSKIAGVKSFKVPEKWDDYIVYLYEPATDTSAKKQKKRNKENGYDLVVRNLKDKSEYTFSYVLDYSVAIDGASLALTTTGNDSTRQAGVYSFDFEKKTFDPFFRSKGNYYGLTWDEKGTQFSFVSDTDTTKAIERDYSLHYWSTSWDSCKTVASNKDLKNLNINHEFDSYFSKAGKRLFFQTKELPIRQDTTLLEEEIVNVEVWNYNDSKLHTQQKNNKKEDAKLGYLSYYDINKDQFVMLGGPDFTDVLVSNEGDGNSAIALNNYPYRKAMSWEGFPEKQDVYSLDLTNGQVKNGIGTNIKGVVSLSPAGKYAYWYEASDSVWYAYSFDNNLTKQLTTNSEVSFSDEIHDTPSDPGPYGLMSWTKNDEKVLLYDRYDIWEIDPKMKESAKRITPNGRSEKLTYRYVKLDDEERFISKNQKLHLSGFYEASKKEAMFSFTYGKNEPVVLTSGNYQYGTFRKSRSTEKLIFTRENFKTFPDLNFAELDFQTISRISDVNPQQSEYNWGSIELFYWNSLDGQKMEGMLIKPEDFDPAKKYPLLVNFYEKSSDRLNRHRDPFPGRSTINYSYYASRGYIIFNPNVNYRTGYPGESAYNCVIPGVTSLIEKGFIDEENIGVQGHSWGGYQIAYLLGKTDMFKCAEAGAPVANMISAYGGIRWGSGFSRMFQYERTQSRIGGTLWEYPLRYIENSPIFYVDKVNTPVLIMHNDNDGAVPWYQGIEYFVALRRLGKPAWMLNYQGEPHWPVKVQNRIDFNIRLSQYFDFYLKGAPMPKWMRDGVSALETGIDQGYELIEKDE